MKKINWFPAWIFPVILLLAIGTVWLRLAIVRTTYDINQANSILREFQLQQQQLELRHAALRSPRRLEVLARTHFGLTPPRADQIIYMHSIGRNSRVNGSAQ